MTFHLRSIYHFTPPTKETKVNTTSHDANAASTLKTGLFAALRGLLHAQGSGARGPVVAPLVALCVLLALCVDTAQAEPPKLIPYGQFGTHASAAAGVAVEGSGDLFVSTLLAEGYLTSSSKVVKLDPSGNLLSPPSPFGTAHYSGVAVNPTNGDVYVLGEEGSLFTREPAKIFVYDPNSGTLLSSFEVPASRNISGVFTDVQIASDPAGNVYVPVVSENRVLEYSPSGALLQTFTDSGALKEPRAVAIDSSGNLWIADSGDSRIVELDPSGAPVEVNGKPVEIESEGVWSVALDEHGDVLALVENSADPCGAIGSTCLHLVEYSAEGRQLADVGAGSFGTPESPNFIFSGVAVNRASGRVYVLDGDNETVWVFGPPTAPVVGKELVSEIKTSEAKLGALVDPGGIQTTYRFEYGATTAYGTSMPLPEGSVGEGITGRAVWASASGLAPGVTYHYRVVASNELGTSYGPDQTFTTLTAEQAACPNEQLRDGFSARLPDCRAYELVTPPVKTSSQFDVVKYIAYFSSAAADGEAVTLRTEEPQPSAPTGGGEYVATREADGWIAEDLVPLESYDGVGCPERQRTYAYSEQLNREVIEIGGASSASSENENPETCNPDGRQVASGEPVGYLNLLVRDNATGAYRLVNITPPGVTPANAHFQAASADLSHVIFTETSPLVKGAQYGVENLYEWDEGALRLVSVLPNGTAVPGSLAVESTSEAIRKEAEEEGVVSSDGSHVLFTYGGALYDRIDGQRTIQIDESQGGAGPSGSGSFMAALADGSGVFFLDESKLTVDSTAEAGEPDLYECVLPKGASRCELSDLAVAAASEHADVLRVTPLGDHDSADVYFVAEDVLASNTRKFTNSEGKTVVEGAEAGKQNIYLWNGKETTFIAVLDAREVRSGRFANGRTSPDGKWLAFESQKSLTGYDNVEQHGDLVSELFLYSAATGQLVCVSCNPTGEAAVEGGGLERTSAEVAKGRHLLTDAGQVFFESTEALVPSDTNGRLDVYEYEAGHAYLISSGTSSFESNLEDASESGNDVFFRTTQQLVPQDNQEGMIVIYDARVDGGFPAPVSPPACTTADACRTPASPQPALYGAPSSQTFAGAGNLAPALEVTTKEKAKPKKECGKSFVKRRGRCVKAKRGRKARRANRATKSNDNRGRR